MKKRFVYHDYITNYDTKSCFFLKKRSTKEKSCIFASDLFKHRHSFLNGNGRPRTAFFLIRHLSPMAQRVTFYIDGFNFYYGLRRTKHSEPQWDYSISRPEEKKTDVNISVRMIGDCVLNATDSIVLVSADSDLVPPLEFIQRHYPKKRIKVYFPPSNFSCDLKDNLIHHSSKPILMHKNERRFRDAIMPDVVTDGIKRYEIPPKWKNENP